MTAPDWLPFVGLTAAAALGVGLSRGDGRSRLARAKPLIRVAGIGLIVFVATVNHF